MAALAARISDLAGAVRDKINLMVPRLLPLGGSAGQVLTKNSATNYDASWATPASGGGGSDPWTRVGVGADIPSSLATFATITGMSFTPPANTNFTVEAEILLATTSTANMPRIQASVGAGQTHWAVDIEWQASATTKTYAEGQGTTGAGAISIPVGTAVVAVTPLLVKVLIKGRSGSAPGVIALQLACETAAPNGATVKPGSEFRYRYGP